MTPGRPFKTRLTVPVETPAVRATSWIVGRCNVVGVSFIRPLVMPDRVTAYIVVMSRVYATVAKVVNVEVEQNV